MAQLGVIWADGIWNTNIWNADIWAQSGAPDVTAPTVSSWTIAANGLSSSIVFDEAVTLGANGISGLIMTPTNGGAAITLTYSSGDGTNTLVVTHRAISDTETLTRGYTQPGAGIQDASGNLLAHFTAQAVTNGSTANSAPTDISLSNSTILVTAANGAVLGTLSATDPDAGDTHTWSEVAGTGDTNNAAVVVASNGVVTVVSAATLGVGEYTFRPQAADSAANTLAKAFAFTVVEPGSGQGGGFLGSARFRDFWRFR